MTSVKKAGEEHSWARYIGNSEQTIEQVNRRDLTGLAGLLGYTIPLEDGQHRLPWPENDLPLFAHWLNANPNVARSELGVDGHPVRGGFIPDFALPRRMWAGSQVSVHAPYGVGQPMTHRKSIASITPKTGRSGSMIFVSLLHEFHVDRRLVVKEVQSLVYREAAAAAAQAPKVRAAEEIRALFDYDWCEVVSPDPVWLFHYSAVSFNAHQIGRAHV